MVSTRWVESADSRDNPVRFIKAFWPDVALYREQRIILESLRDNLETVCVAGNMLGKDFVAGLAVVHFFLTRHPVRVVTTSADGYQLEAVLWGEIRRFLQSARFPLDSQRGGPVLVNHLHLRKIRDGRVDPLSYVIGRVAAKGEGMLGHHIADTGDGIPRTMFVADEASGVDDVSYKRACTWSKRRLIIGNPFPCTNFFFSAVEGGDLERKPLEYEGVLEGSGGDGTEEAGEATTTTGEVPGG